jgi:hypothetical protein
MMRHAHIGKFLHTYPKHMLSFIGCCKIGSETSGKYPFCSIDGVCQSAVKLTYFSHSVATPLLGFLIIFMPKVSTTAWCLYKPVTCDLIPCHYKAHCPSSRDVQWEQSFLSLQLKVSGSRMQAQGSLVGTPGPAVWGAGGLLSVVPQASWCPRWSQACVHLPAILLSPT